MDVKPANTNGSAARLRHVEPERPSAGRDGGGSYGRQKKSGRKLAAILAGVVLAALLVFGGWFVYRSMAGASASIDNSKYQAVFFTNGQVYFGKLQVLNGGYFKLSDVFYLQAQASDAAAEEGESENPQATSNDQASDVQLIKLGSEVHGPEDEMIISKEQILFFENLKPDGKVTDSIGEYNNQQK